MARSLAEALVQGSMTVKPDLLEAFEKCQFPQDQLQALGVKIPKPKGKGKGAKQNTHQGQQGKGSWGKGSSSLPKSEAEPNEGLPGKGRRQRSPRRARSRSKSKEPKGAPQNTENGPAFVPAAKQEAKAKREAKSPKRAKDNQGVASGQDQTATSINGQVVDSNWNYKTNERPWHTERPWRGKDDHSKQSGSSWRGTPSVESNAPNNHLGAEEDHSEPLTMPPNSVSLEDLGHQFFPGKKGLVLANRATPQKAWPTIPVNVEEGFQEKGAGAPQEARKMSFDENVQQDEILPVSSKPASIRKSDRAKSEGPPQRRSVTLVDPRDEEPFSPSSFEPVKSDGKISHPSAKQIVTRGRHLPADAADSWASKVKRATSDPPAQAAFWADAEWPEVDELWPEISAAAPSRKAKSPARPPERQTTGNASGSAWRGARDRSPAWGVAGDRHAASSTSSSRGFAIAPRRTADRGDQIAAGASSAHGTTDNSLKSNAWGSSNKSVSKSVWDNPVNNSKPDKGHGMERTSGDNELGKGARKGSDHLSRSSSDKHGPPGGHLEKARESSSKRAPVDVAAAVARLEAIAVEKQNAVENENFGLAAKLKKEEEQIRESLGPEKTWKDIAGSSKLRGGSAASKNGSDHMWASGSTNGVGERSASEAGLVFFLSAPGTLQPESFKATSTHYQRRDALARISSAALWRERGVAWEHSIEIIFLFEDDNLLRLSPDFITKCPIPAEYNLVDSMCRSLEAKYPWMGMRVEKGSKSKPFGGHIEKVIAEYSRSRVVLLHEDHPNTLGIYKPKSESDKDKGTLLFFLGAVKDISPEEIHEVHKACSAYRVPFVEANLGVVAEFTSKIIDVLHGHHIHGRLMPGVMQLQRPLRNHGSPTKQSSKFWIFVPQVGSPSQLMDTDAKSREMCYAVPRCCISQLWCSRAEHGGRPLSLVFDTNETLTIQPELVTCLKTQHRAAPTEKNVIGALRKGIGDVRADPSLVLDDGVVQLTKAPGLPPESTTNPERTILIALRLGAETLDWPRLRPYDQPPRPARRDDPNIVVLLSSEGVHRFPDTFRAAASKMSSQPAIKASLPKMSRHAAISLLAHYFATGALLPGLPPRETRSMRESREKSEAS